MKLIRKLIALGNTKNHCCVCWRRLRDRTPGENQMFLVVRNTRGYRCCACGLRYCASCAEKAGGELKCRCGARGLALG
jgi:hypothetical protein